MCVFGSQIDIRQKKNLCVSSLPTDPQLFWTLLVENDLNAIFFAFQRSFCGASEAKRHLGITLSVLCPSVCHTFGLLITFFTLRDRAFIFGNCVSYDKTFPMVP